MMTKMGRRGVLELLLGVIKHCKGVRPLAPALEAALAALLALILGHEVSCEGWFGAVLVCLLACCLLRTRCAVLACVLPRM